MPEKHLQKYLLFLSAYNFSWRKIQQTEERIQRTKKDFTKNLNAVKSDNLQVAKKHETAKYT